MRYYNKYWRIARRINTEQLHRGQFSNLDFSENDLFHLDIGKRGTALFLGYYSKEGIDLAFHKYGVYKRLSKKGFNNVIIDLDTKDAFKHKIALYHEEKHKDNLIIELVVRKTYFKVEMPWTCELNGKFYTALAIDWLLIQNIYGDFTEHRPRLPGQKYPGLGFSHVVLELLLIICWRLNLSGLINLPEHYHNAYLYSKAFYYFDPSEQARFQVIKKTFKKYPLDKISWGIDWGCVIDLNYDEPFAWKAEQQVIPLEKELKRVFHSKRYKEYVLQNERNFKFVFDEKKYLACRTRVSQENMEKCI